MQCTLPILAALALTRIAGRFARSGIALVLVLGLLGSVENLAVPGSLARVPLSPRTSWTAWLRDQPAGTVVAHIPFPGGLHVADYQIEGWRLFHQIDHRQPIVNGYSGNFPADYGLFQFDMARQFPEQGLLCTLIKGVRANVLVVDRAWLDGHWAQLAARAAFLSPVYGDHDVQIYRLRAPEGACLPQQGSS
jgi:hypothetical protein